MGPFFEELPVHLVWDNMRSRSKRILELRYMGSTLDEIGEELELTRERIRQLEIMARKELMEAVPGALNKIAQAIEERPYPTQAFLAAVLETRDSKDFSVILAALGFYQFRDVQALGSYWHSSDTFQRNFGALASYHSPCLFTELSDAGSILGMGEYLLKSLLSQSDKVHLIQGRYVVRKTARIRDLTYLVLLEKGMPMSLEEILPHAKIAVRALSAQLERDSRFRRDESTRSWGLSAWVVGDPSKIINNVYEAVDQVLSKHGPTKNATLLALAMQLFPRSSARYAQILEDGRYGLDKEGKWDFSANGAIQKMPAEPKPTQRVAESIQGFAKIEVRVDAELLRGSGIPVHRRLTWVLGLPQPTRELSFSNSLIPAKPLIVYRTPGGHHLGALKAHAEAIGLTLGCKMEIAFDKERLRAGIRPSCECHSS